MDQFAFFNLSEEPTEEEFCLALRNGLILCNVLNKVNPGAVSKIVENPVIDVQLTEGAAQSAFQYFENMRNFLVAVKEMKLLTFEASDLEKGGASFKVVDCILCLKGYHEWKQAGGIGVWRYGGLVKITSLAKDPTFSSPGSESSDSISSDSSPYWGHSLDILHFSRDVFLEEVKAAGAFSSLFDRLVLVLLRAVLTDCNGVEDALLNATLVDTTIRKAAKELSELINSRSEQLSLLLKKVWKSDGSLLSKQEFVRAITKYLGGISSATSTGTSNCSQFCICGVNHRENDLLGHENLGHAERLEIQQRQLEELKSVYGEIKLQVQGIQLKWEDELNTIRHHFQRLQSTTASYNKVLEENRMLYDQVQDLEGHMRVYCRVRPFLPGQADAQSTVDYIAEDGNITIVNPSKEGKDAMRTFAFNKVFGTNSSQAEVFADIQPLVRSVLDGFNVCIFAYGQTGSGKTYTMSGPDLTTDETMGVNYRALNDLFRISRERKSVISYEVGVQMIEIYNEQIRDLLVVDESNRRLDIRNNSRLNGLNVPDARLASVSCTHDVLELMRTGQRNRAVGATALNMRSSRSHSVFTVHIEGKEKFSGSILRGCLHLVDLAGSERILKSEAVGDRVKEALHINRSLSALGDVISALAQKSAHVPYRNSKLTQVLQDSLRKHAKTLMFVHINPDAHAYEETISTLKFAERASSIELGAVHSSKEFGEIKDQKEEISYLKMALERKETEIKDLKVRNVSQTGKDAQKRRAASPLHLQRCGNTTTLTHEINQQAFDCNRHTEVRSSSSGRQRTTFGLSNKEQDPKLPLVNEKNYIPPRKIRTPSPPVKTSVYRERRSVLMRNKKVDTTSDNQSTQKVNFPVKVAMDRSMAAPLLVSWSDSSKGCGSQEPPTKQENISQVLYQLQHPQSRKIHHDHDEGQFKPVPLVRQGSTTGKSKSEGLKTQIKHQFSTRILKLDAVKTLESDIETVEKPEEPSKNDFPKAEKGNGTVSTPMQAGLSTKKLPSNFTNISQGIEPRILVQPHIKPMPADT